VHSIAWARRLTGPLDRERLRAAVDRVVARHAALRTRLERRGDAVQQVVEAPRPGTCDTDDWSAGPPLDEAALGARLSELAAVPFALTTGAPLVAVRLIRLAPADHVLLWLVHHAVADGWSMDVIERELAASYNGTDLSSAPPSFLDHATLEAAPATAAAHEAALDWWSDYLRDAPTVLELPADFRRPPTIDWAGDVVRRTLPPALTSAVSATGARVGATPFMTLLAAWAAVLGQYSGAEDLLIGTPVAGRVLPTFEHTVGFFANTLAVRADLRGHPTFLTLVDRLRRSTLDAFAHQHVPFDLVVDRCQPERRADRMPLVQAVVAYQQFPLHATTFAGLTVTRLPVHTRSSKFDCTLFITPVAGTLALELEFATAVFDRASMTRLLDRYQHLLDTVTASPHLPLSTALTFDALPRPREVAGPTVPEVGPSLQNAVASLPSAATEQTLASIWANVLGIASVGPHDNFFALGGHSLLAATMLFRVAESFDVNVSLQTLYGCRTLRDLSARIDAMLERGERRPAPISPRRGRVQ
jgi:acyl carrier protein